MVITALQGTNLYTAVHHIQFVLSGYLSYECTNLTLYASYSFYLPFPQIVVGGISESRVEHKSLGQL